MKVTIVNGTNRIGNKTINITQEVKRILGSKNMIDHVFTEIITLENFTELFRGEYLSLETSNEKQKADLQNFEYADLVIFVVPVYHRSIPGSLKNFLDILEESIYDKKVFAFIGSGKEFGAAEAKNIVEAIIAYKKHLSITIPRIEIIDYDQIDEERLNTYLDYVLKFMK